MFLGVDIGTSSVKAVVVDEHGIVVADASVPLAVSRPKPGFSEQEPDDWWEGTLAAIRKLPREVRNSIQALGLAGQMHGATLLDRADRPLRPAILWNDGRSASECRELETAAPDARRITGNLVMPGFTAPKLLWVRNHEPEIFKQTSRVLLPKDYVRLRMTGDKVTDMSDASGTAWLDVAGRCWSEELLAATGIDQSYMPSLAEGNAVSGVLTREIAEAMGLPRVPVAAGAGDNAASAVAMGVVAPGEAFLSLGTSGVLFVATDRFRPNPDRAVHAFCHCLPTRWHQMAVLLSAASALDWIAGVTGHSDLRALVLAAQETGLRRDSPFFLPYLSGERTPHNDARARGVFFGLSHGTSAADLTCAVLEGVALAFADGLEVLGGGIGAINLVGGGARFGYWAELLSAALNRPLTFRRSGDVGAAFGAARLARLALTQEVPDVVCAPPEISHVIEPGAALAALLAERRPLFQRLYRDLKATFTEFAP